MPKHHTPVLVMFCFLFLSGCHKEKDLPEPINTKFTLEVIVDPGIDGQPKPGKYSYEKGMKVNYGYRLTDDYRNLIITRNGIQKASSDTFLVTENCTIKATAEQFVLWRFSINKPVYYSSPAIGEDGTIYIGSGLGTGGALCGINKNGTLKWKYEHTQPFYTPVIGLSGNIFVQDNQNVLFAFTPDGTLKWTYSDFVYRHPDIGQLSPAIATDGTVYISADGLHAVNPTTGTKIWHDITTRCKASPTVGVNGTIYVVFSQDKVRALRPNGTLLWSNTFDNAWEMSYSAPTIATNGTVYIASEARYQGTDISALYAFNPETGEKIWRYEAPNTGFIRASPITGPDGTIFLATKALESGTPAKILAITQAGSLKWEYLLKTDHLPPPDIYCTPALGNDGLLYFAAENSMLYAIKASDGKEAWTFNLRQAVNWSSPAISTDGTMYLGGFHGGTYEGSLLALVSEPKGYAASSWPKFRNNNKNTGRNSP